MPTGLKLTSSALTSKNSEIHLTSFILEQFELVYCFKNWIVYLNATFSDPVVLLLSCRCQ